MQRKPQKICVVVSTPMSLSGTEVWIGDRKIPHVRNVAFVHRAGELPTLVIELFPKDGLEIEGSAVVTVEKPE